MPHKQTPKSKSDKPAKPKTVKTIAIVDESTLNEEELLDALNKQDEEGTEEAAPSLAPEPLFAALLRSVVSQIAHEDVVLNDYVNLVVPELPAQLGGKTAKGVDFAQQKLAEGKSAQAVARYRADQSLRAHLINGLFPATHIARILQQWNAPRLRYFDERAYRLLCAGYTLHDWLKLPDMEARLEQVGLAHDTVSPAKHLPMIEDIFREWSTTLQLDKFLAPVGGLETLLHEVIYIACNTQVRWGTILNQSMLPRLMLNGRTRQLLADLSRLADLIAYIARNPRDLIANPTIYSLIVGLSDNQAGLVCHHIAENRGVLTNFIHSAALEALASEARVALLYAPSGVVYLERKDAPVRPSTIVLAKATIKQVQMACKQLITTNLTGFSRDGKGLKRAAYYDLHFSAAEEIRLTAKATFKLMPETKASSASKRYTAMVEKELAPQVANMTLPDDIRVDQLAEFCQRVEKIVGERKVELDVADLLLTELGLKRLRAEFDAIPRDNRAGGVAYHWYYIAGVYTKQHAHKDPTEWRELLEQLADSVVKHIDLSADDDTQWDEIRTYIERVLTLGGDGQSSEVSETSEVLQAMVRQELERYTTAKKRGRGATAVCSLCSSSYQVDEQREAGILFSPQVYTNKQPLHSNKAIRNICQICAVEMMLRQILMNHTAATGGRFEGRRMRYLFFYPTYFFTPETLTAFRAAYQQLKHVSIISLRKALVSDNTLRLDVPTYQRLQPLLLDAGELSDGTRDRMFRLHYPTKQPVTFFFMGMPPPSRDAKDAEAWINPAFLSLVLPLALDVKVIASESQIPLMLEADELDETVFLDAPHDFVEYLIGRERVSWDGLLPRLRVLTAAYFMHLDGNAGRGRGGYDYRWQDMPALARALSDNPLHAFAYLKKWQRKGGSDSIPTDKAKLYMQFVKILDDLKGGDSMSHAKELTKLYRNFYRADGYKSNAILKPIQLAAKTLLSADRRLFGREGLHEALIGELNGLVSRVASDRAEGRLPAGSDASSRAEAVRQFAAYFLDDVFYGALNGDTAALRGKQLNLLKNACEAIYLSMDAEERAARKAEKE